MNYYSCKLIFLARYMLIKNLLINIKQIQKLSETYFVQNKNKNKYKTDTKM